VSDITLTLIGKPSCHLCDDARVIVSDVVRHLMGTDDLTGGLGNPGGSSNPRASRLIVRELSIEDDRALFDEYSEQIPVLLVNGKVHNFWRIDPVRLTTSLKELL